MPTAEPRNEHGCRWTDSLITAARLKAIFVGSVNFLAIQDGFYTFSFGTTSLKKDIDREFWSTSYPQIWLCVRTSRYSMYLRVSRAVIEKGANCTDPSAVYRSGSKCSYAALCSQPFKQPTFMASFITKIWTKFRLRNALRDRSRRVVNNTLYYSTTFRWCTREQTLMSCSVERRNPRPQNAFNFRKTDLVILISKICNRIVWEQSHFIWNSIVTNWVSTRR